MFVIDETEARTTRTPSGVMTALAGPSQGSTELSTWRVRMEADAEGPVHTIDREQVWMPLTGSLAFTVDGVAATASAGQAAVLPAGVVRQVRVAEGPAEALVCMSIGGQARVPGNDEPRPLPWAQ
ncbi:cupin domain-containing protein [Micromonospora sonneratiae]|uniref:Cupin domain-containing protein n=1 Tax=Micromonospora sonneratiae TaxID=1184706 RepID=A0ABW3YBG9_9ACTN